MATLSSKRQLTLPIDQCNQLGIKPGDTVETYVYQGKITVIKKTKGAAFGIAAGAPVHSECTDEESLLSALDDRG